MFITPAYAQAAGAPGGGDILSLFLPMLLILGVFWFFIIRPQQKKIREHQELLKNIRRGDTIVTSGGLIGKVVKVNGDDLTVELADGVRVKVRRPYVAEVVVKGQPVAAGDAEKKTEKKKD